MEFCNSCRHAVSYITDVEALENPYDGRIVKYETVVLCRCKGYPWIIENTGVVKCSRYESINPEV